MSERRMQDCRDTMRELWGEEYEDRIGRLVKALEMIAEETDRSPFEVAVAEATRAGNEANGMASVQLIAAACEIAEQ